ncbi:hypothetical protein [Chondromyces apiculatus]|uniref:Uncharacterized protein n=1 Tax=Chondromyces apiculatus DSM 436 TaxID=1192034 RepID=A0A017SVJ5_9BACT|nr:hypothetical protein [Chondromyces apiculatus]EYF00605.1 Hypothetical protein CAP_0420 [Chondromyces apiculatus DSM 436]
MESIDVPEARSLEKVRAVVQAIKDGVKDKTKLADRAELTDRHVDYHRHAARVIGLVDEQNEKWKVTKLGNELLGTPLRSPQEAAVLQRAIRGSVLMEAVPALLDVVPPTLDSLAEALTENPGLSPSTARKRARALLAWRAYLREITTEATLDDEPASEP